MLDEALSVLVGLWSGETFSYTGEYYHVQNACFLPRPMQQPRIPIWVGGYWPNKAPFHRAAQWDGVFPLFKVDTQDQELAQLGEAVSYLAAHRKHEPPLEIIGMGMTPGAEPSRAADMVTQRAELGATWWLECIAPFRFRKGFEDEWPLEKMRERILQGPQGKKG